MTAASPDPAMLVVESAVIESWDADGANPFDPRKPLAVALTRCSPYTKAIHAKAVRTGGQALADHIQRDLPAVVEAILAERQQITASTDFCVGIPEDMGSPHWIAAHHCESGVKIAGFKPTIPTADNSTVYITHAKTHQDRKPYLKCKNGKTPANQDDTHGFAADFPKNWWARYIHLGVGERVYERMRQEHPSYRWPCERLLSEGSKSLRQKVHNAHPYTWEAEKCETCDAVGFSWRQGKSDANFPKH